jgi:alpha-tubulin suppressor-like RCC1 family protein
LGDNTTALKNSPVQTISGGNNWKQVSAGRQHVLAIKTDGTLWTWGRNGYQGTLGTNNTTDRASPGQTVSAGTNWKHASCGGAFSMGIKTDGTLWLWGDNLYGQLGDNTRVDKSSPVQTVSAGTNWKSVSGAEYHTAAIKTDGTLWLWGRNAYGELGINNNGFTNHKSSPVQTISGGTNWKNCFGGGQYTAAIKTDGTLWMWGDNASGQLGDNTIALKNSPVQTISGGNNWRLVGAGSYNMAAIKTDGTLWTWGQNSYGALGDNTIASKSSPIQTVAGGNNWKSVSCSQSHTVAIKDFNEDF